uniref:Uncharacterized protein n=1 Tax=Lotharella oceanica TaxID=641309 RepID=A0A7S2TRH3_9EUKA|mmetsp:Transcript_26585/g.49671  ORF Transcript_26585/g.49671 Transcript_26585/m.49671 type:complete len:237 (+) Transcript_26585:57-767(+)
MAVAVAKYPGFQTKRESKATLEHSASTAASLAVKEETRAPVSVLTIFDWDDTLMPSTYLQSNGFTLKSDKALSTEEEKILGLLEKSVVKFLTLALKHGDRVCIITSAQEGWVELSAKKFYPSVAPLLKHVTVISARSTYEERFPNSPLHWKYEAFRHSATKCFADNLEPKSIISFGDSMIERHCVRAVSKLFENSLAKSVKFAERPSLEQLRSQVDLALECFPDIITHKDHLDLAA